MELFNQGIATGGGNNLDVLHGVKHVEFPKCFTLAPQGHFPAAVVPEAVVASAEPAPHPYLGQNRLEKSLQNELKNCFLLPCTWFSERVHRKAWKGPLKSAEGCRKGPTDLTSQN